MLGAIIGDMVGSVYEFNPIKTKKFNIFNINNWMTDDSMLTLAVAKVLSRYYPIDYSKENLAKIKKDLVKEFVATVKRDPGRGYGGYFYLWALENDNNYQPYNSYGNGAAMRISPVGWIANSEEEVKKLSKAVTEITHNHPEGLKGAEAVAMCIYLARTGKDKVYIKQYVRNHYYPDIDKLDFSELQEKYGFEVTCQRSVPQAIYCFLISDSLEDAIRNCVAIGGDCDTTGAMAGGIAEAYYQKDELSKFEEKFIYLQIEPNYMNQIKSFYSMLNNKKLINLR